MADFFVFFNTGIPLNILYLSLFITGLLIFVILIWGKIYKKKQYILMVLLGEYLFTVISSTLIFRRPSTFAFNRLEIMPFWTYKAILDHIPGVSIWDIVLNIVLFIPLGFLIELLYPSISILRIVLITMVCSLFIEVCQYFYEKGIAQFDDMIGNFQRQVLGKREKWVKGVN